MEDRRSVSTASGKTGGYRNSLEDIDLQLSCRHIPTVFFKDKNRRFMGQISLVYRQVVPIGLYADLYISPSSSLIGKELYLHVVVKRKLVHDHVHLVHTGIQKARHVDGQIDFGKRQYFNFSHGYHQLSKILCR